MMLLWTIILIILLALLLFGLFLRKHFINSEGKFNLFSGEGFSILSNDTDKIVSIFVNKDGEKVVSKNTPVKNKRAVKKVENPIGANHLQFKEKEVDVSKGESKLKKDPPVLVASPPEVKEETSSQEVVENKEQANSFVRLQDALNGGNYSDVANFLASKGMINFDKKKIFRTELEAKEFMKSEVLSLFSNKYLALKEQISSYRKKGIDVHVLTLMVMRVPLKIKLLESDFKQENLEKLIELINSVQEDIDKLIISKKD